MSFDHRLEGHNPYELSSCQLVDAIHSMTSRAESVAVMLEGEFHGLELGKLSDEMKANALSSIRMELLDIKQTVSDFHEFQQQQERENQK